MSKDISSLDVILLEDVLDHIHNWFVRDEITGKIEISDNALPDMVSKDMLDGQWYRVRGSYLNDGLHRHIAYDLRDETFTGTIALLAIPRALINTVFDIQNWQEKNGEASDGPYASESFGGYSYTLKTDSGSYSASGGLTGWRLAFRDRLNQWRKMY